METALTSRREDPTADAASLPITYEREPTLARFRLARHSALDEIHNSRSGSARDAPRVLELSDSPGRIAAPGAS
jgi:hypothetical protein